MYEIMAKLHSLNYTNIQKMYFVKKIFKFLKNDTDRSIK